MWVYNFVFYLPLTLLAVLYAVSKNIFTRMLFVIVQLTLNAAMSPLGPFRARVSFHVNCERAKVLDYKCSCMLARTHLDWLTETERERSSLGQEKALPVQFARRNILRMYIIVYTRTVWIRTRFVQPNWKPSNRCQVYNMLLMLSHGKVWQLGSFSNGESHLE